MKAVVIKLDGLVNGQRTPHDGQYVKSYDPSRDWSEWLEATPDIEQAKQFPAIVQAVEYYRQANGLRADGFPNRPLTAFTVKFLPVEAP